MMENRPSDPEAGSFGCNAFALALVLLLVGLFALAAWLWWPADPPQPVNAGVPPVPPG